jgi:hypothetical protein
LIKFISENPEVYKELTRKYGFEYQHKLNALFKNNNDVVVVYRGYFDPAYNIEAGRVYLDNGSWYFFTASAQTQADRLKDLIDRVGEIEGNDEVRSPILTPGDIASWFNPDRSVRNNLDYVEPEIEKIVKDLAWELAGEVIQEATGAKLAAAGGSAAIKGGTQAVAAASNSFAAFLQWRKYKRLGKLDAPRSGVDLELTYKPGWTEAQRAAARQKVQALTEADTVVVKSPQRSGTSASSRYKQAGNTVPSGHDVDHFIDLQLGGADDILNMNPLDASVNRSLGSQIQHRIKDLPAGTRVNRVTITGRPGGE